MSELSNQIRAEFEGIDENDFPLNIFPQKIKSIAIDLKRYNGYPIEYTLMSIISAVGTAIGNSYRLHVMENWDAKAVFFVLIVGLPASCKSHPMNFAYKPLEKADLKVYARYQEEMKIYNEQSGKGKKDKSEGEVREPMQMPVCKRTILSDITPEVLTRIHSNNKKGVAIKRDEFIGLIKTLDQYNKGQFIESLLTSWSGGPLYTDRCNNPAPSIISHPHINIIGSIQPGVLPEFITESRINNGFIDRCLFVLPCRQEFVQWQIAEPHKLIEGYQSPSERWDIIMQKFVGLEYDQEGDATVLEFSEESRGRLFNWRNDRMNAIPKDTFHGQELGRFSKMSDYTIRLSLVIQLMRWACGACGKSEIDIVSVESAIRLMVWLEGSYTRTIVECEACKLNKNSQTNKLLAILSDEFTTSQAHEVGKTVAMQPRTVDDWLVRQVKDNTIEKIKQGLYKKR